MLPEIPDKLWQIDEVTVAEHFSLGATDRCFYVWEYAPRKGYAHSPTNQLIRNLKIEPTALLANPARQQYKDTAIAHGGRALRHLIPRVFVEEHATFVPVPGSKARGHPDFDDRMRRVLDAAFSGYGADVRDLLTVSQSMVADHRGSRLPYDELRQLTRVTDDPNGPPRPVIVVVDDVLNSGKHFQVAKRVLTERYPSAEVRGLFLARCVRDPVGGTGDQT